MWEVQASRSLSPAVTRKALTTLCRLAHRRPEAQDWLAYALEGRLTELAEVALEVAVESGDPIGRLLANLVEKHAGPELAERLMLRCGQRDAREMVPLLEVAVASARKHLSFVYRSRRVSSDASQLLKLATTLGNLGSWLGRSRDWPGALAYHGEATAILREVLAARGEEIGLRDLAISLSNLAQVHGSLGAWEEALAAAQEATRLLRREEASPALAESLRHLGIILSEVGRPEEALAANREAFEIQRCLASNASPDFLIGYARDLVNLAGRLREQGRLTEALPLMEEAIKIRQDLAAEQPEMHLQSLALTIHNFALVLNELGRTQEALAQTREAVRIRRQLATVRPEAFAVDLASSLHNLGNRLADQDCLEEALTVTEEVIHCDLGLLSRSLRRFLPDLADRLTHRCALLHRLGRTEDVFAAAQEGLRYLMPYLSAHGQTVKDEVSSLWGYYVSAAAVTGKPTDPAIARGLAAALGMHR